MSTGEGLTGEVGGLTFKDGEVVSTGTLAEEEAERVASSLKAYFKRKGYLVVDGRVYPPNAEPPPAPSDPRDIGGGTGIETLGTPLRDAAVDPRPGDFLVPTNAGEANPHGPEVVAPGLHAVPPAPIVPGAVSDDPQVQDATETAVAEAVLVDGADVGEAIANAGEARPMPARNASKEAWVEFAVARGMPREDADALKRDELADRYPQEG